MSLIPTARFWASICTAYLILSCNNSGTTDNNTSKDSLVRDSAGIEAPSADTLKGRMTRSVPNFYTSVSALRLVNKNKFILFFGFSNITDFSTMKLYAYKANSSSHDGTAQEAYEIAKLDGRTTTLEGNYIIFCNSHVNRIRLIEAAARAGCNMIRIQPVLINNKLVVKFFGYSTTTPSIADVDLGQSNPSPPADPGPAADQ